MVLSSSNRKSFPVNLHIPPLSYLPFGNSPPPSEGEASRSDRSLRSSFIASPSRASFLSPRSPHIPASLHLKQEQPVLPIPLTDGLDPSEKMKLLRKAKKLSRILGEVPIPVAIDNPATAEAGDRYCHGVLEEPSLTSASSASSNSLKSPPAFQTTGSLQRSATVGHHRHSQQNGIHRAHSLASLRPSLTIPPAAITIHSSPISPIVFSWPEKNPIPPSPLTPITPSEEDAQSKHDSNVSSKRDSVASSIFPSERSPEQVQRTRAAKLARQLGENIPPELLMRASSPQPRSPLTSPSMVSFAEASLTIREPPRRAFSARPTVGKAKRRENKRRLSLDLRAFVKLPEPPPVPPPALSDPDNFDTIQFRSQHTLAGKQSQRPHETEPCDTAEDGCALDVGAVAMERDSDVGSDCDDDCSGPHSLEKQKRALNVRRARKMLQVFGNEPPPSLFQITNIPLRGTKEGISVSLNTTHCKRDSQDTTVSVSVLANELSVDDPRAPQRDSVGTTSSSGENLSPLIFADPGSVPPSQPQTPRPGVTEEDSESLSALPPLPPSQDTVVEVCPASPLSVTTVARSSLHSLSLASTASSIPASRTQSVYSQSPHTSPIRPSFQITPPSHTTMFLFGPSSVPTTPSLPSPTLSEPADGAHPSDPHFRMRRLRAAKLSRFFGVGLNDIAGLLRGNPSSGASAAAPSSPPLREFRRSDASESIPSPTSTRSSHSARPLTSAGVLGTSPIPSADSPPLRERTLSSATRTRSLSRASRRPQTQPVVQSIGDRYRSNSQPEALAQQSHNRIFSTTVEVSTENRSPFAFLDGRRPSKAKEMDMHDVIRQLRKIK